MPHTSPSFTRKYRSHDFYKAAKWYDIKIIQVPFPTEKCSGEIHTCRVNCLQNGERRENFQTTHNISYSEEMSLAVLISSH